MAEDITEALLTWLQFSPQSEVHVLVQRNSGLKTEVTLVLRTCLHSAGVLMLGREKLAGGWDQEAKLQLGL